MPVTSEQPAHIVDAVGLTCPMPVLMARKALRILPVGSVIELRASDPLARIDVPHFCSEDGHSLLVQEEREGILIFHLRKNT